MTTIKTALFQTGFIKRIGVYWALFFVLEIFLRISSIPAFFRWSIFTVLLLSIPMATIYAALMTLVPYKCRRIFLFILMPLTWLFFVSQIVYNQQLGSFWTISALGHAGGIMVEFIGETVYAILRVFYWIMASTLPIIAVFRFEKSQPESQIKFKGRNFVVISMAVFIMMTTWATYIPAARNNNGFWGRLYGRNSSIEIMHERSGLTGALGLQIASWIVPRGKDSAIELSPPGMPSLRHGPPSSPQSDAVITIDFDRLIREERNGRIRQLHEFFDRRIPTHTNDFTGMFEGYNLVKIVAEAFHTTALHSELTPTLYHMANNGFQFTNFYNPSWPLSTKDGEFVANLGLLPAADIWSFVHTGREQTWLPFALGNQFNALGIEARAYHNHDYDFYVRYLSHPNMGYFFRAPGAPTTTTTSDLPVERTWFASDYEMARLAVDDFINMPRFHAYFMTVSGHLNYNFNTNDMAYRHRDLVADLPYSRAPRAYLATQIELELMVSYIVQRLDEAGQLERTLFVISPDHFPYGLTHNEIEELAGHEICDVLGMMKSTLIVYAPGMDGSTVVDKPASSLDILPTVLNLMGMPFDSRLLMGRDIMSCYPGLVIFQNRDFITSNGRFYRLRNEFVPNVGANVTNGYIEDVQLLIDAMFAVSTAILELDYYRLLYNYLHPAIWRQHPQPQ